ncbi:MAG: hypothetical protein RIS44_3043 [Pseudomonadota bacterium]|jgi:general secretion pathway protein L
MTTSFSNDLRLFGLDLRQIGRQVRLLVDQLQQSSLLRWLAPQPLIQLSHPDGSKSIWRGGATPVPVRDHRAGRKQPMFTAIELPGDSVLIRECRLPNLSRDEISLALSLQVQAASPFPAADLVWGWISQSAETEQLAMTMAMASRKWIDAYLGKLLGRKLTNASPEVWVLNADGQSAIVLAGYAEAKRYRFVNFWRKLSCAGLFTSLLILFAIACTPTAQLRLKAIEATRAYDALFRQTQPVVNQRDLLIRSAEQLDVIRSMWRESINVPKFMDVLTRVLPDDTVLQSLQIDGGKVSLSGYTDNTAALMKKLSAEPGFLDVKAPTPALRPPGGNKEVFKVELTLDTKIIDPDLTPAPASPSASSPSAIN